RSWRDFHPQSRQTFTGAPHLDTTTGNLFLPRPARNERGEGRGEGHPVEWASSPQPSPPVGEERELISSGCLVVVTRCAPEREQLRRPRDPRRAHLGTTTKSGRKRSAAMSMRVPVLAMAQLNRSNQKEGRKPTLAVLRDSGSIEQDADFVGLLHQDENDPSSCELLVGKNRSGETGAISFAF